MSFNLLEHSRSGGCGCKIDPARLGMILEGHKADSPDLLVGPETRDDAAVMAFNGDDYLISTTDFFLPIVSDAYGFGQIAAANALSDVYAMGGEPVIALSIMGWPLAKIPPEEARRVLKGAADKCAEAGIVIGGGHSIETAEPIFGLSVTGRVIKANLKRNNTCTEGDLLYLTKPLGLGLLSNALKHGRLSPEGYKHLLSNATQLNVIGSRLGQMPGVTAMTDVTGFGLLGHLSEMLAGNQGAELFLDKIPVIEEAKQLAMQMLYPNITTNNYNHIKDITTGLEGLEFLWLCDPQTSGGLLFTSASEMDMPGAACIGRITPGNRMVIR